MKKKILLIAGLTLAFVFICFSSCTAKIPSENYEEEEEATETEPIVDDGLLHIAEDGYSPFRITYSERADDDTIALAEELGQRIFERTGIDMQVKSDYVSRIQDISEETPEILLGLTNRKSSIELNKQIEALEYAIKVTDTKVVIIGKNVDMLTLAVDYFVENYLRTGAVEADSGEWIVEKNTLYVSESAEANIKNLMSDRLEFGTSGELILELDGVIHGGCLEGNNYYALIRSDEIDKEVWQFPLYVVKYDIRDKSVLKISEQFFAGSGVDIDYDGRNNLLMIAHGDPEPQKISYITTRELLFSDMTETILNLKAITYLSTTRYAAVDANTGELIFIDHYLYEVGRYETEITDVKSIAADDRYIYLLGTVDGENSIAVYNRSGEFINNVKLDFTDKDPQTVEVYNGKFIIGFLNDLQNGGELYEVKLEIRE